MRKNFGAKPWTYPQPVLILATYGEDGTPDAMNAAWGGISEASEISRKLEKAGWHTTRSEFVDAPLIDELPMALECRLVSYDPESCRLVGEIVNVSADERILGTDGRIDPDKLDPITFDPIHAAYRKLGEKVGSAFQDGKQLM